MAKRKPKADAVFLVMPYETQVALFYDQEEMASYYEKRHGVVDHAIRDRRGAAMASRHEDKNGVSWFAMFLPRDVGVSTIVHECSHVVDFVLGLHGVPLTEDNTEVRAYTLQRLFEDVTEHFKSLSTGA